MLVLTRRPSESIIIANNIKITVVSVGPGRVKLGIEAPSNVRVDRQEIHDKIEQSSDVITTVIGATPAKSAENTLISGPDTAMIVSSGSVAEPAPADGPQGASGAASNASPPALPMNRSRLPRRPR